MSKEVMEQHERGANIIKLRRMVAAEQALNPLMEEVGLLYGMGGDEIAEILSIGASVILHEAGVAPKELSGIEAVEANISNELAQQHTQQQ